MPVKTGLIWLLFIINNIIFETTTKFYSNSRENKNRGLFYKKFFVYSAEVITTHKKHYLILIIMIICEALLRVISYSFISKLKITHGKIIFDINTIFLEHYKKQVCCNI